MPQSPEAQVTVVDALQHVGSTIRYEFRKIPALESIAIQDAFKQSVFNVRLRDSVIRSRREFVGTDNSVVAVFEKNLPTLHGAWTVRDSRGEELFNLHNAHMFPKNTLINLECTQKTFSGKELFMEAFMALERMGLGAEGTHLSVVAAESASLGALAAESAKDAIWEKENIKMSSHYPHFQFHGSWSEKACAMYIAGSETKIAQMHPRDDDSQGFVVDVIPNVNREFVIACFAVIECMKCEAQKQKEWMGNVAEMGGRFLGGLVCGVAGSGFGCSGDCC